ncbi:MAG: cupin domain-containing protein [Acidobacteria bacterium]|nr:cupin domain-containing protein [Acidobacteriota bacterium]
MSKTTIRTLLVPAFIAAALVGSWLAFSIKGSNGPPPVPLRSSVMKWSEASSTVDKWGEMRKYFRGETYGTTNMLTAIAVIKPGESVHPAHRHSEEEFLVLTEGSGRWHLDGKEFAAEKGDVLYVAPWVMHGLVNTGQVPLTFFVVRWDNKGVQAPPTPAGPHGK